MTERDEERISDEDEIVVEQGRLVGCRGRVLVALVVLAVLFAVLAAFLVRGMMSETQPQPVKRAAADSISRQVADGEVSQIYSVA